MDELTSSIDVHGNLCKVIQKEFQIKIITEKSMSSENTFGLVRVTRDTHFEQKFRWLNKGKKKLCSCVSRKETPLM